MAVKVEIQVIWMNSVIIPIQKIESTNHVCSYRPISFICTVAKVLEWILLPYIMKAFGSRPSLYYFQPRYFTTSVLLPISYTPVIVFNERKPLSRRIFIAVDYSKPFYRVSHRHILWVIHCSWLRHNLVKWLLGYLRAWKETWSNQCHLSPSQQVRIGGSTAINNFSSPLWPIWVRLPFNHLWHDVIRRQLHSVGSLPPT